MNASVARSRASPASFTTNSTVSIRFSSWLRMALCKLASASICHVEFVVKEAGDARERATEAYRYHLRTTGAQVRDRRLNRALEDSGN